MKYGLKLLSVLLLCLTFNLFSGFAAKDQDTIRVKVTILKASNEGSDFNFENDVYRDQLVKLFSYTAYQQINAEIVDLPADERSELGLPDEYKLLLTNSGVEDSRSSVQAVIRKGSIQYVSTVLSILNPGVVFLGGPPIEGGILVIVLETGF